mmetsp:Transcript_6923/g.22467  ORF Transcript_6923/g.22467 Transcript_6923/m.22467 type:complete len:244 (+) Transcript_6923:1633-2364(+)
MSSSSSASPSVAPSTVLLCRKKESKKKFRLLFRYKNLRRRARRERRRPGRHRLHAPHGRRLRGLHPGGERPPRPRLRPQRHHEARPPRRAQGPHRLRHRPPPRQPRHRLPPRPDAGPTRRRLLHLLLLQQARLRRHAPRLPRRPRRRLHLSGKKEKTSQPRGTSSAQQPRTRRRRRHKTRRPSGLSVVIHLRKDFPSFSGRSTTCSLHEEQMWSASVAPLLLLCSSLDIYSGLSTTHNNNNQI